MVQLRRTRHLNHNTCDLSYTIAYETEPTNGEYRGGLKATFDLEDHDLRDVHIDDPETEELTTTVDSLNDTTCTLELITTLGNNVDKTRAPITIDTQTTKARDPSISIAVPLAFPIARLHEIFTDTFTEDSVDAIHDQYDKSRLLWSLFAFQDDCQYLLSFNELVTVMDTVAEYHTGYRDKLASTCDEFFTNMLLHEKLYRITSQDEFEERLELYNGKPNLGPVDRDEVERLYLREWYDNPASTPTDPDVFGFSLEPTSGSLTDPVFLRRIVDHVLDDEITVAQELIRPGDSSYSKNRYQYLKEAAQEGPPVKRAEQWEELLPEAACHSPKEFEFVLGNFLYWTVVRDPDFDDIELEIDMCCAAAKIFAFLDLPILQQRANCQQHRKEAHRHRFENDYDAALFHAAHAREIAENKDGSWETTLSGPAALACRDYALLHRNLLLRQNEREGAIRAIARATRLISEMEIADRFQSILLHHLAANRHEVLAGKAEADGDLLTAKKHLEQSFYHFDQSHRSKRKTQVNHRLERLIDRIQEEEVEEAFRERERRKTVPGEEEAARDPEFRRKILVAYDERCAFCGARRETPTDGRLETHAAHIRPVEDGGPDLVQNGIALCRLHHWAFDNGWLALTTDFIIEVADRPEAAGYEEFVALDGTEMALPEKEYKHPGDDFVTYHRHEHGFDVGETDIEASEITEVEIADKTSADIDEATEQNVEEYLDRASTVFSERDVRGSKNELISKHSL